MGAGEEDCSLFYSRGQGSDSLSHSGGRDWSLGKGVGSVGDEWEELASEIAHFAH